MNNDKELFYKFEKEIDSKNQDPNSDILIEYDDKNLTETFSLNPNIKNKIISSLTLDDLDPQSIVRAPSTAKYYVAAISEPNSTNYYNIEKLIHTDPNNNFKELISGDADNNLKLGTDNKLVAFSSKYKKILTEEQGEFTNGTWNFNCPITNNTKYFFCIDIANLINDVRPFQVEFATIPFKLNVLTQTYQVISVNGEVKGYISISIDTTQGIQLKSNVLSKDDEIQIYERETNLFDV